MIETGAASVERTTNGGRRRNPAARALVGDIIQFVDFLLVIATSILVAYLYHTYFIIADFDFQYYAAAGIIGATLLTAMLRRDEYYEFDRLTASNRMFRVVLSRWGFVILGLLAFGFALKISEHFSRVWLLAWSASAVSVVTLFHLLAAVFLRRLSDEGGVFTRRIAVVGVTNLAEKFIDQVTAEKNGVSIAGVYDADVRPTGDLSDLPVAGDLNTVAEAARNGDIDDIVITLPRTDKASMARVVDRLSTLPVSIAICPNAHWLDHTGGAIVDVGGATLLSLYRRPLEGWGGVLKTIEDYVLGAILLAMVSPLLLLIAAAIKITDRGPILFAQRRHGFNHSVFPIYKFRTMTVAEDSDDIVQAKQNDPRITRLGGFLRRYSLDELPQLLNVMRGEMSLVGPRPHALAHNHQYAQLIENYSGRHKVKPGITGWAQVNGYRGRTSENELMKERVNYDLSYIDNWSLWFDLKILVLTAGAVLFPKNAV